MSISRRSAARLGSLAAVAAAALVACASSPTTPSGDTPLPGRTDIQGLQLVDLEGRRHTLAELEGDVVLVDFWATRCTPCVKSLPLYERWQQELGPRGLKVVAISVDEEDAPVAEFARRYAPSLWVMRDAEGATASRLGLPKMPTAFLVGRDGAVRSRYAGFTASEATRLRADIEAALAAPAATAAR